jgi:hypothetical protein
MEEAIVIEEGDANLDVFQDLYQNRNNFKSGLLYSEDVYYSESEEEEEKRPEENNSESVD